MSNAEEELTCALCLSLFQIPVELQPCRHIFCEGCIRGMDTCPMCRQTATSRVQPHRMLLNILEQVRAAKAHGASDDPTPPPPPPPSTVARQYAAAIKPLRPAPTVVEPPPWIRYSIDPEEYDHLLSLFIFYDEDDSGYLDLNEVRKLTKALNYARTESDVLSILAAVDKDGNAQLSFAELCTWLCGHRRDTVSMYGLEQKDYHTALFRFRMFDDDNDGALRMEEFVKMCVTHYGYTEETARDLFRAVDANGNGTVDLHEFLSHGTSRFKGRNILTDRP